ncbi:small ribosomal subunit biogenesis GTPase RsgA [Oscillatoria sp. FACHB-1406]|uniref:small ribosomal subunit biogenesis GTPase RsgA n=1 Tax=Oscillatoria sp. FACHB-1406 TaxID=2692846 RepID=UPI0016837135|nr:small ribosomal subunit biogenesis GTPase RsgA [Oscillatoria sp. FACHB-1406]MBD2578545.1 small ribosomal subunit biogenesis GTPase RsgA [Oscillatoria sp. FACHB-1406]
MSRLSLGSEGIGRVVAVQANFYQVRLESEGGREILCTRRARLKKIGQNVMVGDRVRIEELEGSNAQAGAIAEVFLRQTELKRPPIANADRILLVFALAEPHLDPWQLSRFLVTAEATDLTPCLCLNKKDLISPQQQQQWQERLKTWGYEPILISVACDAIEELETRLAGSTTIVAGPSGAGKSSLLNRLLPESELRVGAVSGKLLRGRHTTRHVQLFELPAGGFIADSPGFNKPSLECNPQELARYFPEARSRLALAQCQFGDCWHRNEPNCAVRGDWERYEHYLEFLSEAIAWQQSMQSSPDAESNLKLKIKSSGQERYEPRLETKKYRRSSRKTRTQNLQQMYDEEE